MPLIGSDVKSYCYCCYWPHFQLLLYARACMYGARPVCAFKNPPKGKTWCNGRENEYAGRWYRLCESATVVHPIRACGKGDKERGRQAGSHWSGGCCHGCAHMSSAHSPLINHYGRQLPHRQVVAAKVSRINYLFDPLLVCGRCFGDNPRRFPHLGRFFLFLLFFIF